MSWPKHPDGRNKKVGEMTDEERLQASAAELKALIEKKGIERVLAEMISDPRLFAIRYR
jgi:hypothetical protein